MTSKQLFDAVLFDLNKKAAPDLLLEEYNYYINKGINQFYNKTFNNQETTQPITDELRVLQSSASLSVTAMNTTDPFYKNVYYAYLPDDYVHILNCIFNYNVVSNYRPYNKGMQVQFAAQRLPSDQMPVVLNDYFRRPLYKRPYFYMVNITQDQTYPVKDDLTPVYSEETGTENSTIGVSLGVAAANDTITLSMVDGSTQIFSYQSTPIVTERQYSDIPTLSQAFTNAGFTNNILYDASNTAKSLTIVGADQISSVTSTNSANSFTYSKISAGDDYVERIAGYRYGNQSRVKMELRYGPDSSVFQLANVYVQYMKAPQYIRLTQDQVDSVKDISQKMEFPDQTCYEIVNETVRLIMEREGDQRQQTFTPTTNSIATPAPPQEQEQGGRGKR